MTSNSERFKSFKDFYPYYLSEHKDLTCRRLHFIGTWLIVALWVFVAITGKLRYLWLTPIIGYGFAWAGHALFEKNKPATFTYPLWSLMGDWKMWYEIIIGKVSIKH